MVEVKLTSQSSNGQPPILQNKHLRMKTTCERYSFCILSSADRERNHMVGWTPSQHHSTPCLHKQSYMQFNLSASKCRNTQLVGTKPASAEERLLPSPSLCIRRADVSCAVIFWVSASWTKPWCWPLLIGGGWWRNKDTSTTERLEKL